MQVVFIILKPLIYIIARSPFWLLYFWSNLSYFLFYKVLRYRVKVVRKNLGMVFPTYLISELKVIEKKFYKQLFDLVFEGIKLTALSEKELLKRCVFTNPELINSLYQQNKNVIIVMGHTGNWEWASGVVNLTIKHQLQSLYQPIKTPKIEAFILETRKKFGTELIERKKALRTLLQQKNSEQLFATNFLADQSPYQMQKAEWLNFFGLETPFFNGYAAIAQKLKAPIVFLHIKKVKRGYYSIETELLSENPENIEVNKIVSLFAKKLEREIIKQPFNWLWSHKRWKRAHLKPK
ncbi:MAG: lysophospholipid acyltransferase family protein [Bacteroidia bacterium]